MDLALLIARYGLPAIFIGSLLEGETVLVIAGFAAHRGYLDLEAVVAMAWLGAVVGDQFLYWLGRRHGSWLLSRFPRRAAAVERALGLIARHPIKISMAMRFAWGLRTALPIAIGMSGVGRLRFLLLNLFSAAVWAPLVAGAGWAFGAVLTRHLGDLQRIEHWVIAGLVGLALVIRLIRRLRRREAGR